MVSHFLIATASPFFHSVSPAVGLASEYNFPALSELISQFHTATRTSSSTSPVNDAIYCLSCIIWWGSQPKSSWKTAPPPRHVGGGGGGFGALVVQVTPPQAGYRFCVVRLLQCLDSMTDCKGLKDTVGRFLQLSDIMPNFITY